MSERPIILIVDDEVRLQEALRRTLSDDFIVLCASDTSEAEMMLEQENVTVILCDQRMPGRSGVEFLSMVRERWPDPVRMIISGYTDSEDIIAGINTAGVYQYITKPWDPGELLQTLKGAVRLYELQRQNQAVSLDMKLSGAALEKVVARKRAIMRGAAGFDRILRADDSPVETVCREARKVAVYDLPVLITGESGTGKELLARAIHYGSHRADSVFLAENCGALPDDLLESELFGSKKGAYTGAHEDRIGLFEQADGGTIFLDEIGETSPSFQVKLLRVLQENEIRPLGSKIRRQIDLRVIAATNRDLEKDVQEGRFRRDLFYRLAGFQLHLPPLRERTMDIPLLANKLLADTQIVLGKSVAGLSDDAMRVLRNSAWPGNVRELQNVIQRLVVLAEEDEIQVDDLPVSLRNGAPIDGMDEMSAIVGAGGCLKSRVEHLEEMIIADALARHNGNISRASSELGLSRVGLRGKMERYGLEKNTHG